MKVLIALNLLFSSLSLAGTYPIPNECKDGRDGRIKAEGPNFVIINTSTRFKGDQWNPLLEWENSEWVKFYNDYEGFVGGDSTNIEANAYLNMTFPFEALGRRAFWVKQSSKMNTSYIYPTTSTITHCSYKRFWVQREPSLNVSMNLTPNYRDDGTKSSTFADFTANYWVDQYSKVRIENDVPEIKWYTRGSLAVDWQLISESDSVSRNFYGGVAYFKVVLNDGTFEDVEEFFIQPSEPALGASQCVAKPWLCNDNDL